MEAKERKKIEELKTIKKFLKRNLDSEWHFFDVMIAELKNDFYDNYEFEKILKNLQVIRSRIILLENLIGMVDAKTKEIKEKEGKKWIKTI